MSLVAAINDARRMPKVLDARLGDAGVAAHLRDAGMTEPAATTAQEGAAPLAHDDLDLALINAAQMIKDTQRRIQDLVGGLARLHTNLAGFDADARNTHRLLARSREILAKTAELESYHMPSPWAGPTAQSAGPRCRA